MRLSPILFFFNDTATTEIYTLSLHDALPICTRASPARTRRRLPQGRRDSSRAPSFTLPFTWSSVPAAAGPLGALPLPAPAAVRQSRGAPAPRSTPAADCSPRLRALPAEAGIRWLRALQAEAGIRCRRCAAADPGPITRTPARAPRESRHATARLLRPRTRLRPG